MLRMSSGALALQSLLHIFMNNHTCHLTALKDVDSKEKSGLRVEILDIMTQEAEHLKNQRKRNCIDTSRKFAKNMWEWLYCFALMRIA